MKLERVQNEKPDEATADSGECPDKGRMTPKRIQERLVEIEDWHLLTVPYGVERRFSFPSTSDVLGFFISVGEVIENLGHVPAIDLRPGQGLSKVEVTVRMADPANQNISERDFDFAAQLNESLAA